ncbi:predicted protein [Postia placenta Mad-698-R]|uniref:Uncharacterized protein n=1 Tax=Postia placenta MAD-698-R-SB12 TaxID=670580 RepID=A0A1X6N5D0_9APHY|nr:hypothetical protein POSPLADRAFT_1138527 [Postia placenta MAD-698-R-SB12]EED80663.1 predicted protein [Postia placenta Mad-698-R]OSX63805.1 hypothetical protein POSPLADRAFT_1138527 [Postia placenta MAD-698-R-SB12]
MDYLRVAPKPRFLCSSIESSSHTFYNDGGVVYLCQGRIVPKVMLRPLPVEIWLLIINELGAKREYDALKACAEACEGLIQERAIECIPDQLTFRTPEEVGSINVRQRCAGPEKVHIEGGRRRGEGRISICLCLCDVTPNALGWAASGHDVPLRPHMLSELTNVHLGMDFSLCSDPRSVHDLLILFPSRRLEEIKACLSTSLC